MVSLYRTNRIIAVDPGKTTGIAAKIGGNTNNLDAPATWQLGVDEAVDLCEELLNTDAFPGIVVCESFVPRPGAKTWQSDAVEIIGVLRHLSRWHGHKFYLQSPTDAKRFVSNDRLRALGWYRTTEGGHMNDAMRHMLLAQVRHGCVDAEELL